MKDAEREVHVTSANRLIKTKHRHNKFAIIQSFD